MATLISTTYNVAAKTVTATVQMTVQNVITFPIVMTEAELIAAATGAGRSDWNTADVCSICSTAVGLTVTKASSSTSNSTANSNTVG